VTTSSPESEPHVEHTILANGIRQEHKGGLVLSQLHIGLAVGFAIVACLTAFGGGIIVGMWYKAGEQIAPISASMTATPAESPAQSQETMDQPPTPPAAVTFYNTLTNSNMAYAPLTPPVTNGPSRSAKGAVALAPATGTMGGAKAASAGATPARGDVTGDATGSTKTASVSKASSATAGTTRAATVSESQKHTKATPAAKVAPAETAVSSGGTTKTAVQKPATPTRQARKETEAQQHVGTAAPAKAPGAEDARVPGGSSGSSEKGSLARVQPAAAPGQGPRYRVRLGGDTERTAADQTAQRLTAHEQVPAIVAGRD
jgi:hypothetical protein